MSQVNLAPPPPLGLRTLRFLSFTFLLEILFLILFILLYESTLDRQSGDYFIGIEKFLLLPYAFVRISGYLPVQLVFITLLYNHIKIKNFKIKLFLLNGISFFCSTLFLIFQWYGGSRMYEILFLTPICVVPVGCNFISCIIVCNLLPFLKSLKRKEVIEQE